MPIYEYKRPDGSTFEVMQSFSDDPLKKDPETGVKVQRVLHAPTIHFKGKGFYNTDYGTRKRQRETAAAGEGSSNGASKDGGSSDSSSSSDGKSSSEGKSETKSGGEKTSKDASTAKPKSDSKPVGSTK
ncbi:MAG TPA: zinc ribbon domain-containing protein [Solirubrobacteraceae bacterium]|jgi:putative FmdB family regulatory protein